MSDVKEMIVKGIIYSFKDAAARERITALQADVNRIYSDFAEYDKVDHPDIIFGTPTQTGAIVNGNGAVVPMEGYKISNPISVTKGLLYKLFIGVGATIPAGIAVFAIRRVSEDGRVVYTPAFISNNTTKVSRLGYLVFFASENAEIVFSYPASTNKLEVAEYGVLKSLATQIDNLRKEVDLKSFADGYYAQMSVGYARNLIMPNTPTEQEFSLRQSGGGMIESGVSTYDKIMGKSEVVDGEIINNKVEKVKSTGINLWDEEWENGGISTQDGKNQDYVAFRSKNYIKIPFGQIDIYTHFPRVEVMYVHCYDKNKAYLGFVFAGEGIVQLRNDTAYIRFASNFGVRWENDKICINISDPAINGNYFPYEEHTLDLSWIKEIKDENGVPLFEDGLRDAGSAFDEVKANVATKRMVEKVFDGTENWVIGKENNYGDGYTFYVDLPNATTKFVMYFVSNMLNNVLMIGEWENLHNGECYGSGGILVTSHQSQDLAAWKSHLAELYAQGNPLKVVYELAEPIVVEYPEKSMSLEVVAGGTETAIATEPSTPMRAMISYGIDAVATILSLVRRVTELEGKIN